MKRAEMIKLFKDYLELRDEDPNIHSVAEDAAEYLVGCWETWRPETTWEDDDGED